MNPEPLASAGAVRGSNCWKKSSSPGGALRRGERWTRVLRVALSLNRDDGRRHVLGDRDERVARVGDRLDFLNRRLCAATVRDCA